MVKTKYLKRFAMAPPVKPIPAETMYLSKNNVDDETVDTIIDYTMDWCVEKFGMNEQRGHPYVCWEWNTLDGERNKDCLAYFEDETNTIIIRARGHRTVKNFIRTLIHEYIHYLQPTKGGWYERWNEQYGYEKNPYEIEAYYLSDMYAQTATNFVMKKI